MVSGSEKSGKLGKSLKIGISTKSKSTKNNVSRLTHKSLACSFSWSEEILTAGTNLSNRTENLVFSKLDLLATINFPWTFCLVKHNIITNYHINTKDLCLETATTVVFDTHQIIIATTLTTFLFQNHEILENDNDVIVSNFDSFLSFLYKQIIHISQKHFTPFWYIKVLIWRIKTTKGSKTLHCETL